MRTLSRLWPVLLVACGGPAGSLDAALDAGADASEPDSATDAAAPLDASGLPVLDCPVAVVGGSASGVSAAFAAATLGVRTCVFEEGRALGGQLLIVPELDENPPPGVANEAPYSDSYRSLRRAVQAYYRNEVGVRDIASCGGADEYMNPGRCTCCRVCYEPAPMARAIEALLAPLVAAGTITIFRETRIESVERQGARVTGLVALDRDGARSRVEVAVAIDATELGDLIPLAGVDYRTGAEPRSDTGETHARDVGDPECVQPLTYPVFVEVRPPGEDHRIPRPPGYDSALYQQRFYTPGGWIGATRSVEGAESSCGTVSAGSELTWRRMRSTRYLAVPSDITQINTVNDFNHGCLGNAPRGCNPIDKPAAEREAILTRGRDFAAGYLYYLQNDVPRDDGVGNGYPNLRPAVEVTGTPDGVASDPYIRESRRIRALTTVVEEDVAQEIVRAASPGAVRARLFESSVGLGQYALDLHMSAAGDPFSLEWHEQHIAGIGGTSIDRTLPFQVPLGALIPAEVDGFVAAGKNIGTTHITNGAYRLHPVEWHIGLAAGVLAATSVDQDVQPRALHDDVAARRCVQDVLVRRFGSPLHWYSDVFGDEPALFAATQLVAVEGIMRGSNALLFEPDLPMERWVAAVVLARLAGREASARACPPQLFTDVACDASYRGWVDALVEANGVSAGGNFRPAAIVTRRELAEMMGRVLGLAPMTPATPAFTDVPASDPGYAWIETARAAGLFRGDVEGTVFRPGEPATRATGALWSYGALRRRYAIP